MLASACRSLAYVEHGGSLSGLYQGFLGRQELTIHFKEFYPVPLLYARSFQSVASGGRAGGFVNLLRSKAAESLEFYRDTAPGAFVQACGRAWGRACGE